MAKYKVEITGINTNEINVLSNEEMTELFKRLQENNEEARNLLVQGNLKLVLSILKKYLIFLPFYALIKYTLFMSCVFFFNISITFLFLSTK